MLFILFLTGAVLPARLHAAAGCPDGDGAAEKAPRGRLYLGLWTVHFRNLESGLEDNALVGLAVGKVYGATFVNSFGERAYSAGFQDVPACWSPGPLTGQRGMAGDGGGAVRRERQTTQPMRILGAQNRTVNPA